MSKDLDDLVGKAEGFVTSLRDGILLYNTVPPYSVSLEYMMKRDAFIIVFEVLGGR